MIVVKPMGSIFIILLCLIINAILSCIEMAFVTVSRPVLKAHAARGSLAAAKVLLLKNNPERVLSVLQIGITLVGAISAAVGGASAEEKLTPLVMQALSISEKSAEMLSIILVVLPLTYLSVVVGELVPKSLALRFPMKSALAGSYVLGFLDKLFAPFVWFLEISTKFFTKILFAWLKPENYFDSSREVDLDPLTDSHKQSVFNLIDINKRKIGEIMVPWEDVNTVDISEHHFTVIDRIRKYRNTRFPVTQEGKVIGILMTKEFVAETEVSKLDWTELIRPMVFISPNQSILAALRYLQFKKSHMAIVMENRDGEETYLGVVTIEDIFEEVIGDIYDQDDNPRTLLSLNSRQKVIRNYRK